MPTLIIQDDDGSELHRSRVPSVPADLLAITVLTAIRKIPPPRKPRSDKGKSKSDRPEELPPAATLPQPGDPEL